MTSIASIQVFSTCPYSSAVERERFLPYVMDVARWSEQAGFRGILVYTDNSTVDPWLVSQIIIQSTETLCPLVAVQPVYMHPYSVAKMVTSMGHLYGRRMYLNMVAGGFKNDLEALNDMTPHDRRYERLIEYTTVIKELLASPLGVSYEGEFYKVDKLKMTPPLSPDLSPGIFVSGSSEAGLAASKAIGAVAIKYPKPVDEYEGVDVEEAVDSGVRVGIITRKDHDEAWRVAHERFPEDRKGQIAHQLAMKVSDSTWHKQLSEMGEGAETQDSPYWLIPFKNYKTFCPYLVGSYSRVAEELARYIAVGYETFILDIPPNEEELYHIGVVFDLASKAAGVKLASKGVAAK
ncbi:MAG: LLM class flavin-dependent oxidoreductase [Chloracidobacterium sp.]|nr:LLM class flavin-dependent oxidoreductase [Chloracidobacterium sp.]